MKTAIKLTVIAVITVFAVLACAPEAELTSRDYTEYQDSKNPLYTNNASASYTPSLQLPASALTYSAIQFDEQKQVTVRFPITADVLKKSDTEIAAELKKFMNFYLFTSPEVTVPQTATVSSTLSSTPIDYTFVGRNNAVATTATVINVTVQLANIPDTDSLIFKIDASKYTVANGKLIDRNRDGAAGDIYDDIYVQIPIIGSNIPIPPAAYPIWYPIITKYNLNVNITGDSGYDPAVKSYIQLATLVQTDGNILLQTERVNILEELKASVKFEKYDQTSKKWVDGGTVLVNDQNAISAVYPTWDGLYVENPKEDLGIFRVVTTMDKYKTKDKYGASEVLISNNNQFLRKTSYSGSFATYNQNHRFISTSTNLFSLRNIKTGPDGKNVVIELYTQSQTDTSVIPNVTHGLEALDKAKFNDSFRVVYNRTTPGAAVTIATSLDNIVPIGIDKVEYKNSKLYEDTATVNNLVIITLDPNYQHDAARTFTFFINTGFKYTNGTNGLLYTAGIINVNNYYDGKYFWAAY